jgi:ribose transport system permease protein
MKKANLNLLKALILPAAIYLIFLIPNFQRFGNIDTVFTIFIQSIIPTIIGYAVCFSFICGIFDFSIGSRIIISALVGSVCCTQFGIWGLVIGATVASLLLGIVTGAVNRIAKIPSLIVTLGLTMVFEVIGNKIVGTSGFITIPTEDSILAQPPYIIIVLVVSAILFYFIMKKTKFSFHAMAVGNDEIIARNMGINVPHIKYLSFVVGAVFLAIASILQLSLSSVIAPAYNLASATTLFKPLMGVIVGLALQPLCSLFIGIFIGEFSINLIFIGLIASGLPDTLQNVTLGVFLLLIMLFSENKDTFIKLFKNKKILNETKY